jgi:hypothetical protein
VVVYIGYFLKNTKIAQIFGPLFQCNGYVFVLSKNGLGYILSDFFTNASGRPAVERQ